MWPRTGSGLESKRCTAGGPSPSLGDPGTPSWDRLCLRCGHVNTLPSFSGIVERTVNTEQRITMQSIISFPWRGRAARCPAKKDRRPRWVLGFAGLSPSRWVTSRGRCHAHVTHFAEISPRVTQVLDGCRAAHDAQSGGRRLPGPSDPDGLGTEG